MNFSEEEYQHLEQYQQLLYSDKLENGSPLEKAELIRNILVHLHCAYKEGRLTAESLGLLSQTFQSRHSSLVDTFDSETGLNNYADGALSMCSLHRNESQKWRSSLTVEGCKKREWFQKVLKNSQGVPDNLVPLEMQNSVLMRLNPANLDQKCDTVHAMTKLDQRCDTVQATADFTTASRKESTEDGSGVAFTNFQRTDLLGKRINNGICTDHQNRNIPGQQYDGSGLTDHQRKDLPGKLFASSGITDHQRNASSGITDHQRKDPPGNIYDSSASLFKTKFQGEEDLAENRRKPLFSSNGSVRGENPGYSNFSHGGSSLNQQPSLYRKNDMSGVKRPFREIDPMQTDDQQKTPVNAAGPFRTAKEQLNIDNQKKCNRGRGQVSTTSYGTAKKSLGTRRGPNSKFVPPVMNKDEEDDSNPGVCMNAVTRSVLQKGGGRDSGGSMGGGDGEEPVDERLKGIEPKMIELIMNEIMDHGPHVAWDDIAGLEFAKKTIKEIVVWPMLRPDIFTGLRGPPKGLLLFGPPGTGKTLIGKCIASQSKSTFFSISASSLTSKWVGEGEKMVRAMFAVARCNQPAVVFIDEIDSLLSQRSDGEHEASRRIKTEFLVQLDGAATVSDDRILVIGATNRPQEIDEAARRRFVKRLYIPLPEGPARSQIVLNLLAQQKYQLTESQLDIIQNKSDGYSGADMANLCREAALGPIRSMAFGEIENITADQVRPILHEDFEAAFMQVRASVSDKDLDLYIEWNKMYGSTSINK